MKLEDALRLALQHFNRGKPEIGADLCRQILQAQPGNPVASTLLGRFFRKQGASDQAKEHADAALRAVPEYAPALELRAELLADDPDSDLNEVRNAYRRAMASRPDQGGLWFGLANTEQGKAEDSVAALALYRRAVVCRPSDAAVRMNQATAALKVRDLRLADDACDSVLSSEPRHVRALAFKTITYAATGARDKAEELIGWPTLTRPMTLPTPAGFADLAAFNTAFEGAIRVHPNLRREWDPNRRAIRGGAVVTDLLKSEDPAIRGFHTALDEAVAAYAADLGSDPGHPHLAGRPSGYAIDCWANILEEQGHQTGHIHNLGWLSGVYYVSLPETVQEDDPNQEGWIEFNRPGYGIPDYEGLPIRSLKPEAGMVVFFPSYVWHRTIPFSGTGERISVAFDLHAR